MAADTDFPARQTFTTSRKVTLSYIHVPPQPGSGKKTLLFLHGCFSHLYDWYYQITHFVSLGYGVIANDHYGYGESSKPEGTGQVKVRELAGDIVELLDHLNVPTVVGISHEWSCFLLSRLPAWYEGRVEASVFLTFPPTPPGAYVDPEVFNVLDSEGFDYLSYIPWFATDPGTKDLLEKHPESYISLIFSADPMTLFKGFHTKGTFEDHMKQGATCEIGPWYPEHMLQKTRDVLSADGFIGPLEYHRMFISSLGDAGEDDLDDWLYENPTLIVIQSQPPAAAEQFEEMTQEWAPNLTCVKLDVGFWGHIEKRDETNKAIEDFLNGLPATETSTTTS
jgi:soluble epoxide hydrolase / lipid-phosphate phosphatase